MLNGRLWKMKGKAANAPAEPPADIDAACALATRPPSDSLIPFSAGAEVIELVIVDGERIRNRVQIVEHGTDWCLTATGNMYTRFGTRLDRTESYRSITSPAYDGARA